jgi:hypothetical protein
VRPARHRECQGPGDQRADTGRERHGGDDAKPDQQNRCSRAARDICLLSVWALVVLEAAILAAARGGK